MPPFSPPPPAASPPAALPLVAPPSATPPLATPRWQERGARKYWLLKIIKKPYPAKKGGIKVTGGTTIKARTLVVDAQWYVSTSDSQGRKSYKLVAGETVVVPVDSLVQEHGLKWEREWQSANAEFIISKESHMQLMCHNYSNVK